ncbi:MAG: hypothetical protein OEM05_02055 [Myxococcales bacterium]|nr:hypothetical protein [Myxococcales bacterium]
MKDTTGSRDQKTFCARRVICHHEERIQAPPVTIFPLLCPIEEYKWIDEWECELVYSDSGVVEDNCIFREEISSALFGSSAPATWITTLHDPDNARRHFVIVNDELVRKAEVSIEDSGEGVSTVKWTTIATTLNEKGNEHFEDLEGRLQLMLRFIATSLKHYCETGQILPRSELAPAH